jgi:gamma-glutamylcysteine synthetase
MGITIGGQGGSLIFLEAHQNGEGINNSQREERTTVVHELGHAVEGIGAEPVTTADQPNSPDPPRYTEEYLDAIRSEPRPEP